MKEIWVDKLDPMPLEREEKSDRMEEIYSEDTVDSGLGQDREQAGWPRFKLSPISTANVNPVSPYRTINSATHR